VLEELIGHRVSIEPIMIQKVLESQFEQGEAQESIVRITKLILAEPTKYLTLDFV
jgi:hypothetical protein